MTVGDDVQRREVFYTGRVQGVGFRYTARAMAHRFAVTGFVRNLPDGRVQLVVEGRAGELDEFLSAIEKTMRHYILDAQVKISSATGQFHGFVILH